MVPFLPSFSRSRKGFAPARGGGRLVAAALAATALSGALACADRREKGDAPAPGPSPSARAAGAAGSTRPSPTWVKVYDPARAWNGYTLTLHEARTPVLLDMNGREVHRWQGARLRSRVRLLPDGSILGIDLGRNLVEYDWEGRQTLALATPGAIPHHDVIRLANGNTLALVLRDGEAHDTLVELDRAGNVVWTWEAKERLGRLLPKKPARPRDVTHFNSVQELPENRWHQAGDGRFRPGNLLVSARNLHAVFVVDRASGEVVWSYRDGLDMQHEALMTAPGLPGAGLVQIFNNRRASFGDDRQSEILELDPAAASVAWRYRAPGFFSPTGGSQQALPNGNLLVTSTRGGRVFEVTRDGAVVWEWVPPRHEPIRALRVAAAACPQLAALPRQRAEAVTPPPGYGHVDPDAYRFARRGSRRTVAVDGEKRTVLRAQADCRSVLLPFDARLRLAWGVDRERQRGAAVDFVATLERGGAATLELVRDRVGTDGDAWRERTIDLSAFALEPARLCVGVEPAGSGGAGRALPFAFWEQPAITAGDEQPRAAGEDEDDPAALPDDLTPEERDVQQRHLETLGYVG